MGLDWERDRQRRLRADIRSGRRASEVVTRLTPLRPTRAAMDPRHLSPLDGDDRHEQDMARFVDWLTATIRKTAR